MRNNKFLTRAILLSASLLVIDSALAATVTWDTSTQAGFQSGNGTWGTDSFWSSNGTTLSPWVSGDQAIFVGEAASVANTITLGAAQNLSGLTFGSATTSGDWTFSGGGMALTANSTFNVNEGSTASIGNVISGAFGLTKAGTGSLTLSGANTYTGATTVSAGTLTLASGGSLGIGLLAVGTGATMVLNSSSTVSNLSGAGNVSIGSGATLTLNPASGWQTFSGQLSGSGSIVKSNAGGESVFSGDNSGYTGAITLSAGILTLQNSVNSLGSGDLTITGASTIGGVGGAGAFLNNKVIVTGGTATLGRGGNTLILAKDVTFGGTSNIVIGSGTVALAGNLTKTGTGTWSVSSGATLQIGNGGTTGAIEGGTSFNLATGNLAFKRSDDVTYSGVFSGTGSLTKAGTGNLTLTGANTYTGTTTVSAGTLTVGSGGSLGTGNVILSGGTIVGGTLNISRLTATVGTFDGVLTGSSGFTKTGVGTLVLGGANT